MGSFAANHSSRGLKDFNNGDSLESRESGEASISPSGWCQLFLLYLNEFASFAYWLTGDARKAEASVLSALYVLAEGEFKPENDIDLRRQAWIAILDEVARKHEWSTEEYSRCQ